MRYTKYHILYTVPTRVILNHMPDETKSKIAQLEQELYSKDFKSQRVEDVFRPKETEHVTSSWNTGEETATFVHEMAQSAGGNGSFMKKFVVWSMGFFVLAVAIAGLVWLFGGNIISSDNIKIEVVAPPAVAGGEPFDTKLTVTNDNNVSIEKATLFLEYPEGFYGTDKKPLLRISKNLGIILAGKSVAENVNAVLYGEENSQKEVNITLEYQTAGSNATIRKTSAFSVKIASSPITLKIDSLKEVSSGQEVEFTVNVESNSQSSLESLLVSAEYPIGFTFRSASPEPTYSTNTWALSALAPQGKRSIKIRGIIEGQEDEQKVLKISVGTQSAKDERFVGVVYNATTETLAITKPFLGLDITIDGDRASEHVAAQARAVRVDVAWQSNNPTKVTDAVVEVKFSGGALNRYSIYASNGGFYRSNDDTIVWQKGSTPELGSIEPGAKGSMSFSFSPIALGIDAPRGLKNPQITFEVRARANSMSETGFMKDITTFATRAVKFESELRLTPQALYFAGPFRNTGPLPPKANIPTTYTIKWSVKNSSNSISNAVVKTTLPIYVTWLSQVSPVGEDISYNAQGSEVTWNVGRISSGGTREAAFQVSLLPSLSQLNLSPQLTGDSVLSGTDDFTKSALGDRKAPVTTYLSTDPTFGQNQGAVVQ